MNSNTATSHFMDKQIMDLSNSQTPTTANTSDFIDFMNRTPEKKVDIVPSYDFVPIRPTVGSSSPPPATRSSSSDALDDGRAPLRTWNSFDSKTNAASIRNYNSLDAEDPVKSGLGKNHKSSHAPLDVYLVSEIDRTMKKYVDNLVHAVDSMSARLSQLETRTRNLDNSVDDLKVSVGNNHGSIEGKMRQLENIIREVQTGVQGIRDKQETVEAQLQSSNIHVPKVEHQVGSQHADHTQTAASAHQQFSSLSLAAQPPPPNAPPPPLPHNLQPQAQFPNQYPQSQVASAPQPEPYFRQPTQAPEDPTQQQIPPPQQRYQMPPPHQHPAPPPPQQHPAPPPPQQHPAPPPPQQHHAPPPPQQHSAPPPPLPQYLSSQPIYSQPHPPSQPSHSSFPSANPSLPQPPLSHLPEETPYIPPPNYSSAPRPPPSQQYYGPTPNAYETPSSKPGPGYNSGAFGEPYSSSATSQYGSGSPVKRQPPSTPFMGQGGGSGYPQLPTARILPQALPTASGVGSGSSSGSGGPGNKVPVDDVVDRVTNMGFPRDQVRATVRRLTENGESVDLNIVLDKLMNEGDGQAQRGWFGR